MNDHEHEFPDDLISAYLDGELSPAEKVRVEEQLMDSAEHRRLFEELKALRRSLQALPAESLGEDFAARVLRRAERELLSDAPAPEKAKAKEKEIVAAAPVTLPPPVTPVDRGAQRGLIWSIVATAAAVGLVVFGPLMNENTRHVTQRDPAERRAAPPVAAAAPGDDANAARDAELAKKSSAPQGISRDAPVAGEAQDRAGAFRAAEEARASTSTGDRKKHLESADQAAQNDAANQRTNASAAPGAVARAKDRAGEDGKPSEKAATDKLAVDGRSLGKVQDGSDGLKYSAFGGASPLAIKAGRSDWQLAAAPPAMQLVTLDVTPAALSTKFFDELLARHDIAVELAGSKRFDADDEADAAYSAPADDLAAEGDAVIGAATGNIVTDIAATDIAATGPASRGKNRDAVLQREAVALHEDVDVMYVVASQPQIDALLRDLQAQHGEVLALAYDSGGSSQKELADGNRFAQRARQVRELADAEIEHLKLTEQKAELESATDLNPAKPQTTVPPADEIASAPAPADAKNDADRLLRDEQLAVARKSSFARRLSLPAAEMAQVEQQLRRSAQPQAAVGGGGRGGSALAENIAAEGGSPAESAPAEPAATAAIESSEADLAPPAAPLAEAPLADDAVAESPARSTLADNRNETAKAKQQQNLVRVLFVLRAVAPPAAQTVPAEAGEAPSAGAKPDAAP